MPATPPSGEALALQVTHQNDRSIGRQRNRLQVRDRSGKARYSVLEREQTVSNDLALLFDLCAATSCSRLGLALEKP